MCRSEPLRLTYLDGAASSADNAESKYLMLSGRRALRLLPPRSLRSASARVSARSSSSISACSRSNSSRSASAGSAASCSPARRSASSRSASRRPASRRSISSRCASKLPRADVSARSAPPLRPQPSLGLDPLRLFSRARSAGSSAAAARSACDPFALAPLRLEYPLAPSAPAQPMRAGLALLGSTRRLCAAAPPGGSSGRPEAGDSGSRCRVRANRTQLCPGHRLGPPTDRSAPGIPRPPRACSIP